MSRVVLDVTRLLTRAGHPAATGVDRVELAYARKVLEAEPGRSAFAAIAGKRPVGLPHEATAAFVRALDAKWRAGTRDDGAAARLSAWLGGPVPVVPSHAAAPEDDCFRRALKLRARAMAGFGGAAVEAGDVYLHVSHIRLDRPEPFERLKRDGARLVTLIHDLIPIRFPEYARPGEDARHARRMTTALKTASLLVANSRDTARDLESFAGETGVTAPAIVAAPLGLEADFRADVPALEAGKPYFVTLGTIEPRKNHLLLLHVWRALSDRLGDATPMLVVVGRRGWENEMVVDLLDRSPAIRGHAVEATGLSDASLASLIKGARALLFPSFAEGYGLPLAEALALGAPTVASDLPAFREIAGDRVDYLDPLDGPAWTRAVEELTHAASPRAESLRARAKGFAPPSWEEHFRIVGEAAGIWR